ncbi:MAG: hypothetical protein C0605_10085 [Hyphomicrobiales bacterium]|nr:MAG: hypothetical protein C0605_10085 [Hyphomicrobiales bacterium]
MAILLFFHGFLTLPAPKKALRPHYRRPGRNFAAATGNPPETTATMLSARPAYDNLWSGFGVGTIHIDNE